MSRKYKIRWSRILFVLSIVFILVLVIYFSFIKDYEKEKLIKIGYSEEEINGIREELTSEEIGKLFEYNYLSYLVNLVNTNDYRASNILSYINYINDIDGDYNLKVLFI